uniref:Uncharacterized protein n=1 Tax=Ciona savignyi TaxID=51511 RepID=H2YP40_CIOSA
MVPLKSRAFAIQEEKNNRRKLRILQVRQQERAIASRVRENVENHKKQEIQSIAEKLHEEFALQNDVEISKSKEKYSKGLSEVGKAQNLAKDYVMEHALYQVNQIKNKRVADQRYNAAIQHMHTVEEMKQQKEQENKDRRIKVAVKEKLRSKQVAMLPSPSVSQDTENSVTTTVQTTVRSCDTFCATMNEEEGDNAREAARDEEETQEKLEQGKLCMQTVQQERAQLRYLSAIKRSKLNRDYNHLEKE